MNTSRIRGFGSDDFLDEGVIADMLDEDVDLVDYLNDETFMQECAAFAVPLAIETMMYENITDPEVFDESVSNALGTIYNYMVGQGILSEASAMHFNPKMNIVHMSKGAQISRLTSMVAINMGRKNNDRAFKKFRIGAKIKKENK